MQRVERIITIDAPVEETFGYVSETANLVEIWPSMVGIKDVQTLPNGGKRFRWVYKMAGLQFEGVSEDLEWIANERIVSKTGGGIESTITWQFRPEGDGTHLALTAEYVVPIPLIGKLAEVLLAKMNEQELEVMLAYLKAKVEWTSKVQQLKSKQGAD